MPLTKHDNANSAETDAVFICEIRRLLCVRCAKRSGGRLSADGLLCSFKRCFIRAQRYHMMFSTQSTYVCVDDDEGMMVERVYRTWASKGKKQEGSEVSYP